MITINFTEDFNRSSLELRLDLKSPELELELKSPELELELQLKLIVSSGIGIGIENNGIGIELKKWNWPQPCSWGKQMGEWNFWAIVMVVTSALISIEPSSESSLHIRINNLCFFSLKMFYNPMAP